MATLRSDDPSKRRKKHCGSGATLDAAAGAGILEGTLPDFARQESGEQRKPESMTVEAKLLQVLAQLTRGDPHVGVPQETLARAAGLNVADVKRITNALARRNRVAIGHDGSIYPGR